MSASLIILVPIGLLAIVSLLGFVGCAFNTGGLPMSVFTDYTAVTVLGNPNVRPWDELRELADDIDYEEFQWGTYYICRARKR